MSRALLLLAVAAVLAGCGAQGAQEGAELGPRYGISITVPAGWHGRITRGAVQGATFQLPSQAAGSVHEADARRLGDDDVVVSLFETASENESPPTDLASYPPLRGTLALDASDFEPWDGITADSELTGHAFGDRSFELSGRLFMVFASTGSWPPSRRALVELNELLGSLEVERGDFYPGVVAPPRFAPRPGWHVGDSGPADVDADGEFMTAWAATIPYADDWNALPLSETLRDLPSDGIAMWILSERNNRFVPAPVGGRWHPPGVPPFRLDEFEHRQIWEGQVRDLPEHVLWRTVRGEYRVDLRVYFGRPDPTPAMRAEAQAMLDGLELPRWGPWELEP